MKLDSLSTAEAAMTLLRSCLTSRRGTSHGLVKRNDGVLVARDKAVIEIYTVQSLQIENLCDEIDDHA
jgi:hypothetical protein